MPGRGTPWRGVGKGKQDRIGSGEIEDDSIQSIDIKDLTITGNDIADGTISEPKLDTALQTKVNTGGGGGGGWTASRYFLDNNLAGTQIFDHSFHDAEPSGELVTAGTVMPKSGKIKSIFVKVDAGQTTSSGNKELRVRNGLTDVLTLSYDPTTVGITKIKSEIVTFAEDDQISIVLSSAGQSATGIADLGFTVEYEFD